MAAFCKSCGAPIIWYKTRHGKIMPIDPDPHPDGNVRIDVVLNLAFVAARGSHPALYRCHFATCPHAEQHRT